MREKWLVLRIAQYLLVLAVFSTLFISTSSVVSAKNTNEPWFVGVAEDGGRHPRTIFSVGTTDLICATGFNTVRITVQWVLGQKALNNADSAAVRNAVETAKRCDLTVVVTIYPSPDRKLNSKPPTTATEQRLFADFVADFAGKFKDILHFEIGNEPNWSQFWWPQFGPDGNDSAIRLYFNLLARTYDKLKIVNPDIVVVGGAFASVGEDDPKAKRKRHSPTRSIELLGQYYKESGRALPIMDWISLHPYPERPSEPPDEAHPTSTTIGLADYDKLVGLLGKTFDGTAQPGSDLPILWSEYGLETAIPPERARLYRGRETSRFVVFEEVQADYSRRALQVARCQPTVKGVIFFQITDDPELDGWQSGLFYTKDQFKLNDPKSSQPLVKAAVGKAKNGGIRC